MARLVAGAALLLLASSPSLLGGLALAAALPPPPPSIALQPNCGAPGTGPPPPTTPPAPPPTSPPIIIGRVALAATSVYTLQVVGRNFPPDPLDIVFNPGSQQQVFPARTDGGGNLGWEIRPYAVPAGTYRVEARPAGVTVAAVPFAQALFGVPCPPPPKPSPSPSAGPRGTPAPVLNPLLALTPAVGPPGTVVTARGTGFPGSTQVQLAWSQGILATTSGAMVTDTAGSFTATVIVFPHDELGARTLTAVSLPPPGSAFTGFAYAPFLVVPGEVQPRDFSSRR